MQGHLTIITMSLLKDYKKFEQAEDFLFIREDEKEMRKRRKSRLLLEDKTTGFA
jgi:hypothetical protein